MRKMLIALFAIPALMVIGGQEASARGQPWCGIYMSKLVYGRVIAEPHRNLKLAREWAHEGSAAGGPCVGCIVVWRHHVGKITRFDANGNAVVLSGNDGGRVRERARSLRGAIAFRQLGGGGYASARPYQVVASARHHYRHHRHHRHEYSPQLAYHYAAAQPTDRLSIH